MNPILTIKKKCKICNKNIVGRKDKIFCSLRCKNYYHVNLRRETDYEAKTIDTVLHRNRSILLEIMGKYQKQLKVPRTVLVKKKFQFKYNTHYHINSQGKMYHYLYDFAWMEFSNDDILIIRKKSTRMN